MARTDRSDDAPPERRRRVVAPGAGRSARRCTAPGGWERPGAGARSGAGSTGGRAADQRRGATRGGGGPRRSGPDPAPGTSPWSAGDREDARLPPRAVARTRTAPPGRARGPAPSRAARGAARSVEARRRRGRTVGRPVEAPSTWVGPPVAVAAPALPERVAPVLAARAAADRAWGDATGPWTATAPAATGAGVAQRAAARLTGARPPARPPGRSPTSTGTTDGGSRSRDGASGRATDVPAAGRERGAPEVPRGRPSGGPADGSQRLAPAQPRRAAHRRDGGVAPSPLTIDRSELERAGGREQRGRLERTLREAARAFEGGRLDEALPRLRSLASQAPAYPPARELYGLALYQAGRWDDALRELGAFAALTGSTEQHPVMADCHRARRRWAEVERLWDELRAASPSAELMTEGRIVVAGTRADQGRLQEAIDAAGARLRAAAAPALVPSAPYVRPGRPLRAGGGAGPEPGPVPPHRGGRSGAVRRRRSGPSAGLSLVEAGRRGFWPAAEAPR